MPSTLQVTSGGLLKIKNGKPLYANGDGGCCCDNSSSSSSSSHSSASSASSASSESSSSENLCGCAANTVTVSFTGITLCSCVNEGGFFSEVATGNPNVTITATKDGTCHWTGTTTTALVRHGYPNGTCSGAFTSTKTDATVRVSKFGSTWSIEFDIGQDLFAGSTTTCSNGVVTINNNLTSAANCDGSHLGYGGSAVISAP
jgi:hypothetical protein